MVFEASSRQTNNPDRGEQKSLEGKGNRLKCDAPRPSMLNHFSR